MCNNSRLEQKVGFIYGWGVFAISFGLMLGFYGISEHFDNGYGFASIVCGLLAAFILLIMILEALGLDMS